MQLAFRLSRPVIDFMLPPRCPGCGTIVEGDHRFCVTCWSSLMFLTDPGCALCSRPLGILDGLTCAPCLATPPAHDGVYAAVAYGPVASRVVLRLKYGRRPGFARTIANILCDRFALVPGSLLIPVPLHRWRMWNRGFNQSIAIADALTARTGLRSRSDLLIRSRPTPSLRGLNPGLRQQAVKGAFAVKDRVDGAHIYLIDDVLTTGATVNACSRALKRAGAASVRVLCWARVIADD